MRIVAISDVHEKWSGLDMPEADLLVVAGDLCERADKSFVAANAWLESIRSRYGRVIYAPGNHDWTITQQPKKYRSITSFLVEAMTVDQTVEIDGLRLHVMPWDYGERGNPETLVPASLDVLISHEPPYGILDWSPKTKDERLGNRDLLRRVVEVKPRLHLFGHCHMAYGTEIVGATTFVNVAICGDVKKYYDAAHPPTIVDITKTSITVTQWR